MDQVRASPTSAPVDEASSNIDEKIETKQNNTPNTREISEDSRQQQDGNAKAEEPDDGERIRRRNAAYSRKSYYRKRFEHQELQEQSYALRDANQLLREEQRRLESLLAKVQQEVNLFHATIGISPEEFFSSVMMNMSRNQMQQHGAMNISIFPNANVNPSHSAFQAMPVHAYLPGQPNPLPPQPYQIPQAFMNYFPNQMVGNFGAMPPQGQVPVFAESQTASLPQPAAPTPSPGNEMEQPMIHAGSWEELFSNQQHHPFPDRNVEDDQQRK